MQPSKARSANLSSSMPSKTRTVSPASRPIWDTALTRATRFSNRRATGTAKRSRPEPNGSRPSGARRRGRLGRAAAQICGPAAGRSNTPTPTIPTSTIPPSSAMSLRSRERGPCTAYALARAREWVVGMHSQHGGWGAFDVDNTHLYLNHIPFADHGALLDPPTEDVTAALRLLPAADSAMKPSITRPSRRARISPPARKRRTAPGWGAGAPITSMALGR